MAIKVPTVCVFPRGGKSKNSKNLPVFYAQVNGGTAFSLRTRDESEATAWRDKKLAELRRQALGLPQPKDEITPAAPLTFDAAWALYADLSEVKEKADKTRKHERDCFDLFKAFCLSEGVTTLEGVTPALIKSYRRHVLAKEHRNGKGHPKAITVNNYVRNTGIVWKFLTAEELYNGENPFRSVPKLKEKKLESKARPWEEVMEVLHEAELHGEDIHKVFIVALCFGVRKSELLRLRNPHIRWSSCRITFHKTKPYPKTYTVRMPLEAMELLLRYRSDKDTYFIRPDLPFWPEGVEYRWDFRKQWRTVFKKVNEKRAKAQKPAIEEFSPHDLRHTLITHLLANDWRLEDVAAFVDQDTLSVTQQYGKKAPEMRRETLNISLKKKTG